NARRHARGRVTIEVRAEGDSGLAAVRDGGAGVGAALRERVLEAGRRREPVPGGAGLGLPLARRLARSCGGDVVLGEGPGGRFVLQLPTLGLPDTSPRTCHGI